MYTERAMFSNRSLKKLILPLIMEQILAMTVGMADTMMIPAPERPQFPVWPWWIW